MSPVSRTRKLCTLWVICSCKRDHSAECPCWCLCGKGQGNTREWTERGWGRRRFHGEKKRRKSSSGSLQRIQALDWESSLEMCSKAHVVLGQSSTHPVRLYVPPQLRMRGLSTLPCCCVRTHRRFRRSVGSLPPLSCYFASERIPWPTDFIFAFWLFPQDKVGQLLWFIIPVVEVAYCHVDIHINSNATSPIGQCLHNQFALYMHINFVAILSLCSTIIPASEAVVQS